MGAVFGSDSARDGVPHLRGLWAPLPPSARLAPSARRLSARRIAKRAVLRARAPPDDYRVEVDSKHVGKLVVRVTVG